MNTEEKILIAAEKIFIKDGFNGARMQDIAAEAGINKALLHYYFRSKENLFHKVYQSKIQDFFPKMENVFKSNVSLIEKLEYYVDTHIEYLIKNPKVPMFILPALYQNPDLVLDIPQNPLLILLPYLTQAMDKGEITYHDPKQLFISIMGLCLIPFIIKPIFMQKNAINEDEFQKLLEERGSVVKKQIKAILGI